MSHQRSRSVFDKFKGSLTELLNIQGPKYATQNINTKSRNPSNVADVFDPNTYKKIETEQATEGPEELHTSVTDRPISTNSGHKGFRFQKIRTHDLQQPELTEESHPKLPIGDVIGSPTSPQISENNPLMPAFTLSPTKTAHSGSPTFSPITRKSTTASRNFNRIRFKNNNLVRLEKCQINLKCCHFPKRVFYINEKQMRIIFFSNRADEAVVKKSKRIMQGSTVDSCKLFNPNFPSKILFFKAETKKKQYYFHPRGKFKMAWDALISITLVYYAFMVPIR